MSTSQSTTTRRAERPGFTAADIARREKARPAMELGERQCLAYRPSPDNPYTTLPPPTTSFVQLRFQLENFHGVSRVVQVPLNYSFATLYKLILFMFGWHGMHVHKARVYSFVETYASSGRKAGQIKRYGREALLDDTDIMRTEVAEYEVVVKGHGVQWHPLEDIDNAEERVEDQDLLVSQVWNPKLRKNASGGGCGNAEMGVIYEYDLGAGWTIHITMDDEEDFFITDHASNLPLMVPRKNKGAPPMEDVPEDVPGEPEAHDKSISPVFFEPDVFARYMNCTVGSRAGKESLEVHEIRRAAAV
ncbi:hypothetical protein DFH06DRAFT_1424363 [Mycena polygramma]|nr:hypothetical protein DFH06DRAFT_1424363 [Mycena polygramma]